MSYFRTMPNGERKLILNAKDKAIRNKRRRAAFMGVPFNGYNRKRISRKMVERVIRDIYRSPQSYNLAAWERDRQRSLTQARNTLHATIRWERTGVWSDKVSASGSSAYVRALMTDVQYELLFIRQIRNIVGR